MNNPTIMVTGGWGYLGACVTQALLQAGYRVRVVDPSPLAASILRDLKNHDALEGVSLDLVHHDNEPELLEGVDAIIHLGCLANTVTVAAFPDHAVRINHHGTLSLARRARLSPVKQFIFASTCSMYAESSEKPVHELSPIEPKSLDTQLKAQTEVELLALSHQDFGVTILRFANLFGVSPRMRFDLVANTMVKDAWRSRVVMVHGTGKQIRPLLHVRDAARATIAVLEKDPAITRSQIFNVGRDELNYRVGDLAAEVGSIFLGTNMVPVPDVKDLRQYRVSFKKFAERIGFHPEIGIREGLSEIAEKLEAGHYSDPGQKRYLNHDFYKSQQKFIYSSLAVARGPLWDTFLDASKPALIKKPYLIDPSLQFRKKWPDKPRVIAVMILSNVASRLASIIEQLPRDVIDEIVLVDNGSTDATSAVGKHLGLRVLRLDATDAYGVCLKIGLKKALDRGAAYVLEVRGDPSLCTLENLEPSLASMQSRDDVILGSRMLAPYRALMQGMPLFAYIGHLLAGALAALVLRRAVTDCRPGIRIYSAGLLAQVSLVRGADDHLFPLRILLQAAHFGAVFHEFAIPVGAKSLDLERPLAFQTMLRNVREVGVFLLVRLGLIQSHTFPQAKSGL